MAPRECPLLSSCRLSIKCKIIVLTVSFIPPPPLPQRVVNIPHTCNFEGGDEFDAVWIGVTNEGKEVKQKGIVKDNKVS